MVDDEAKRFLIYVAISKSWCGEVKCEAGAE